MLCGPIVGCSYRLKSGSYLLLHAQPYGSECRVALAVSTPQPPTTTAYHTRSRLVKSRHGASQRYARRVHPLLGLRSSKPLAPGTPAQIIWGSLARGRQTSAAGLPSLRRRRLEVCRRQRSVGPKRASNQTRSRRVESRDRRQQRRRTGRLAGASRGEAGNSPPAPNDLALTRNQHRVPRIRPRSSIHLGLAEKQRGTFQVSRCTKIPARLVIGRPL